MKNKIIKLDFIRDLSAFVKAAYDVDDEVIVKGGEYTVDGKSILGLMSLDLSEPIEVFYPSESLAFDNFLSQFTV
jgi:hypothetical protein